MPIIISCQSDTGRTILLQGVENNNLNVPLHGLYLKSSLIMGPVVVGVVSSPSARRVDLILGNDLNWAKVVVNSQVSSIPFNVENNKSK